MDNFKIIYPGCATEEEIADAIKELGEESDFIVTDKQVEIVCRELFGEHVSWCLRLHVKQALKKAFENEY